MVRRAPKCCLDRLRGVVDSEDVFVKPRCAVLATHQIVVGHTREQLETAGRQIQTRGELGTLQLGATDEALFISWQTTAGAHSWLRGVQHWQEQMHDIAALYSRAAPIYAEQGPPYFAHAGRRLVELARVQAGDAVLDVATGRGAVLMPAAQRVGPSGRVVGIDIASGMLEHTRLSIARDGLAQASVEQMDAASLVLDSGFFDHALCSYAVFFFPDLGRVLNELRRVLQPGGTVGFAFSRGTDPRWTWYEEVLRDHGALDGHRPSLGQSGIRQPGALLRALERAGFTDVAEIEEMVELFYATPEAWWASLWAHGSRTSLERLQPDLLARVERECLERARGLVQPEGVPERVVFAFILGRKPGDGLA